MSYTYQYIPGEAAHPSLDVDPVWVVAEVVTGYESHDVFIETDRFSVTIADPELTWKLGECEEFLLDAILGRGDDDDWTEHWMRIESLVRVN